MGFVNRDSIKGPYLLIVTRRGVPDIGIDAVSERDAREQLEHVRAWLRSDHDTIPLTTTDPRTGRTTTHDVVMSDIRDLCLVLGT